MIDNTSHLLVLSSLWLLPLVLGIICVIAFSLRALHRLADQALPGLGDLAAESSRLHRWEPRFKLASLLGFALFTVSLNSLWLVLTALVLTGAIVALAGVPWRRPLRRLQAINGFLIMLLIMLPLTAATRPGDTLVMFNQLPGPTLNLRGLLLALTIVGKAWTVALLVESMLATAPLADTMAGLNRLGLPRKVGTLLLVSHRYLFVFYDEATRMRTGMQARGFRRRATWSGLRDLGNFLGILLVRSYERTQQVQQAMLARGYSGRLPQPPTRKAVPADWLAAGLVLSLGAALLLADHLVAG